ncbi:MAG: CdaR family protein [Bacilli bacterium]
MKKIIKSLKKIIVNIYSLIDKIIIVPITKFFLKISDFFKENKFALEKFIGNKQTLIVVSLLFSLFIFFLVDSKGNILIDNSAGVLDKQPVTAIYNEEAYVIEGLPKTADITLIGRKSDIYLAKQYPNHEISVDLRNLKEGSKEIALKYKPPFSSIGYKLDPSVATIYIYPKISDTREIAYDIVNKDSLDSKLIIDKVDLKRNDVTIKGAKYKLEQVATVKALIDINTISNPKEGVITVKNVPLVAYDQKGKIVEVEIVPNILDVDITISSPSKNVPIKVVPKGELSAGKSIKSMDSSVTSVKIYGSLETLKKIEYIEATIDINKLEKNKEFTVNLKNPTGIREMSSKTITVKVILDDSTTKEFTGVGIEIKNLGNNLKAQATSLEMSNVTVIATGSKSVIGEVNAKDIYAYVDLSGLEVGEHSVDVKIVGKNNTVSYKAKTTKITIRIYKD